MCLNGLWNLAFLKEGEKPKVQKTMVPFGISLENNQTVCYSKKIQFNDIVDFSKERLLLHFESVCGECDVFIDGKHKLNHKGDNLPFSIEIEKTSFQLDVIVQSPGCGICQTVWLEKVPLNYIKNLIITPDLTGFDIIVVSNAGESLPCTVRFGLKKTDICTDLPYRIDIPNPQLWSPESPNLYFFSVKMGEDKVITYTGLRTFGIKDGKLMLNGKSYFHHGVKFSGQYKGTGSTALNDRTMIEDITFAKKMGFNAVELINKIECARWYFHCDSLGILVWQNVENNPELRIQNLYNCVSVSTWTVPGSAFEQIKNLDSTRCINTADDETKGDIKNINMVMNKLRFKMDNPMRATVLSKCGSFKFKSKGEYSEQIINLFRNQIDIAKQKGLSGSFFTQLTDTEYEKNGLISFDRTEIKVLAEDITSMSEELLEG